MLLNGLDDKDQKIVNLLLENARLSYSELAARVDLSRVAVKNRVKALEARGVIRGYHAAVDPLVIPEMQTYILYIQTEPGVYDAVTEKLALEPNIVQLCQTSGECCLHGVCVAESIQQMRAFAKRMRSENPGLTKFAAYAVLDLVKGDLLPDMEKEHADESRTE